MRIVCLSDTHNSNEEITVPDGDLLIHAGDATIRGTEPEIEEFLIWYSSLPHKYKIFVAGNHDWLYETNNKHARFLTGRFNIIYLEDSSTELLGLKFYGSPWQPRFYDWAFNLNRGHEIARKWALIPEDTNVLITHGPPNGILDEVPYESGRENVGCEELKAQIVKMSKADLRLHVFGHIHCGYGRTKQFGVEFVNASNCDEQYKPTQVPIVIDL